jgi:hypothetical protein
MNLHGRLCAARCDSLAAARGIIKHLAGMTWRTKVRGTT